MTISVQGIGWVTETGYGSARLGQQYQFTDVEGVHSLVKLGIFSQPFKNFARLDGISRKTVSAVALALQDAGIEYGAAGKQDIGIIGTSREGSLKSDLAYFRDFFDNGRTLSRANLFIYTLPSSPLGEAAIHFGLTGPLLFATGTADTLASLLDMAAGMITDGEAGRMLVGIIDGEEALYFVLDTADCGDPVCSLSEARSAVSASLGITDIRLHFSSLQVKKGTT
jgi:3-oxoacyl-[acyl-carrier-protein] synthase II